MSTVSTRVLMAGPDCAGTPGQKLTILSVDGGGVRGIIPAVILEFLEDQLWVLDGPDARLADYFDIIAGTSTGGLIAAMLTAPDANHRPIKTATEVKNFYKDHAADIFPPTNCIGRLVNGWFSPKYSAEPLRNILTETLHDLRITDAVTDVLMTTFDVKTQQPVFFNKEVACRIPAFNGRYVDVCLATSAAPTYLPAHQFEVVDLVTGERNQYNSIDGGVCANNPTLVALMHGIKDLCIGDSPHKHRMPDFKGYKDILVVSLGTGEQTVSWSAKEVAKWGKLSWVVNSGHTPIVDILQNSSAYLVDYDVSIHFQTEAVERNYLRIQTWNLQAETASVDNSSKANLQNLEKIANDLLDAPAKYRNAIDGEEKEKGYVHTNRDALRCFARWLSDEKRARSSASALRVKK